MDISEEKKIEERWKQSATILTCLANTSPKAFFIATPPFEGSQTIQLPFVSIGVAAVFGLDPKKAMENSRLIWEMFEKEERMKGIAAFEKAKEQGKSQVTLTLGTGHLAKKIILALEWLGDKSDEKVWVGYATDSTFVPYEEKVWLDFNERLEGKIGKDFLVEFEKALRISTQAKESNVKWFEERLLWVVDEKNEVEWKKEKVRLAIVDGSRHPLGTLDLTWDVDAPLCLESVLKRACSLASRHWEKLKAEQEISDHLNQARMALDKAENLTATGALVGGITHDLSSPLSNGALEIEVVKIRAKKIEELLGYEKVKKSDLMALARGLYEISSSALIEIDKARGLLESFKRVVDTQEDGAKTKYELGYLLKNMRESLHPTLRKKGVDLQYFDIQKEIWVSLNVSKTFNWVSKCVMAAAKENKGPFDVNSRLTLQAAKYGTHAYIEIIVDQIDVINFGGEEIGISLESTPSGKKVARLDLGVGMFEDHNFDH